MEAVRAAVGGGGGGGSIPENRRVLAAIAADTVNAARWERLRAEAGIARVPEGDAGELLVPAAVRAAVSAEFLDPVTQEAAEEPLAPLPCCGGTLGAASAKGLHRAAAGSGRAAECPHCRAPLGPLDALPLNASLEAALALLTR